MSITPGSAGNPADGRRVAPTPVLIDVFGVADMLGVSDRHVRRLVDAGKCPPPIRLGGCVRWSRATVGAWIADGCPNCRKRPGVER
jgi:excisionase family DNA binding protein